MANTAIKVTLVSVPDVDRVWPLISAGLDRACRKTGGDTTVDYLWSECRSGSAFLVTVIDDEKIVGAAIYRFDYWTSGKRLKILALCGRGMKGWLPELLAFTQSFAAFGGAAGIVSEGRPAFARLFPEAKVLRCLFELPVTGGRNDG